MKTSFEKSAGWLPIVLCVACATSNLQTTEPRKDLNIITHDQLQEHHFHSAYEAVQSLRSNWLNTRGVDSFRTPSRVWVYFDNVRLGGVESMRGVSIGSISYIEHFDGIAASSRWGLDHGAGVIHILTHPTVVPTSAQAK